MHQNQFLNGLWPRGEFKAPKQYLHNFFFEIFAQFRLVWNNLDVLSKKLRMGHFFHSVFVKEHKFLVRIKKRVKTRIFEIHYFITWWIARWVSKIHVFQFFSIPIKNLCSLIKTKWEKCPIHHFLDKPSKLFQIRRNWAKKVNNKSCPFWVSKVA